MTAALMSTNVQRFGEEAALLVLPPHFRYFVDSCSIAERYFVSRFFANTVLAVFFPIKMLANRIGNEF